MRSYKERQNPQNHRVVQQRRSFEVVCKVILSFLYGFSHDYLFGNKLTVDFFAQHVWPRPSRKSKK